MTLRLFTQVISALSLVGTAVYVYAILPDGLRGPYVERRQQTATLLQVVFLLPCLFLPSLAHPVITNILPAFAMLLAPSLFVFLAAFRFGTTTLLRAGWLSQSLSRGRGARVIGLIGTFTVILAAVFVMFVIV